MGGNSIKGGSMVKGNNFHFPKEHGFSGSCGSHVVKGYMRGGHVKTGSPRKFPAGAPPKATISSKSTPHAYAKGGKIHPSDKEHRDYDDHNDGSDRALYPEAGSKGHPEGYAKGGHWIKGAIKHKGALRSELHVKKGHNIPAKKLEHAAHEGGKLGRRARLAEELKHFKHARGGEIERSELHEPKGTESESYEAARRGGRIHKAKGGQPEHRAARINFKSERRETHHEEGGARKEHQQHHNHHGKAKHRGGHSTPHPFAYGGRMPGAVAGAKHRAHSGSLMRPRMVAPPVAPAMPGMGGGMPPSPLQGGAPGGMKRGGRS